MKEKVLHVCLSGGWGGLERYPAILSYHLGKKDVDSVLLTLKDSPLYKQARTLCGNKTPVLGISCIKYIDIIAVLKIKKILDNSGITVVHVHHSSDLWLAVPAAQLAGYIPVVFTSQMGSVYNKKDFMHSWLYGKIAMAISISEDGRKKMLESCPIPADRVRTIYYGVDQGVFNSSLYNKSRLRDELSLPKAGKIVGMLGRIDARKGQKEFILSAEKIINKYPDAMFIIGGAAAPESKAYEEEIKCYVKTRGLTNNVRFLGMIKDPAMFISLLDVFVLASYEEAFGMVLIEAMSMGVSVIGTSAGGVPEIIDNGKNGLLVPPGDVKELSGAIESLIMDHELSKKLVLEGLMTVRKKFSMDGHAEKIHMLYKEVSS